MNLIDIYVSEIGRQLPRKNRADIEAEIRSVLEDMLEERSRMRGKPVDDELVIEVLKEYGKPEKVAAPYQGERYLIGPRLYPTYIKVIRIVLPILTVLALIGLGVSLSQHSFTAGSFLEAVLQAFAGLITSLISALGSITLVFAILQWTLPDFKEKTEEKEWDPASLRKVSQPDRVRIGERFADILFDFAAVVLLNFYPHLVAVYNNTNGTWSSFPIFTDVFFSCFVPWLTLVWSLDIIINILVLRMGSWKTITRLCNIAVRAGAITVLAFLLATPGLLTITAESITASSSMGASTAALLATLARQGFNSILVIVMIVEGIEIVKHLYRMVAGRNLSSALDKFAHP